MVSQCDSPKTLRAETNRERGSASCFANVRNGSKAGIAEQASRAKNKYALVRSKAYDLNQKCELHADRAACPDAMIAEVRGGYGLYVRDGEGGYGDSVIEIA